METKNPYDCSTCDSEDCSGCGENAWQVGYEAGKQEEKRKFAELCAHCDTPLLKEGEQYERIKQERYNQALKDIGIEITIEGEICQKEMWRE
jgi:hypothetical protein